MVSCFYAPAFLPPLPRTRPFCDRAAPIAAPSPLPSLPRGVATGINSEEARCYGVRSIQRGRAARPNWRAGERDGSAISLFAVLPRLRRFARGLTGSATEADDLVQAACERALARAHQFQEGTRFDSWMFRIVQTIWIDQLRARDVRKEDGELPKNGSDPTSGPRYRSSARPSEVRNAVDRLPPDQRMTLMLVTVEGLSYKEAAEVAGVPVGTIMSRLARARIALQQHLEAGGAIRRSATDAEAQ